MNPPTKTRAWLESPGGVATPRWARGLFFVVGTGFAMAALFHAVAIPFPSVAEPSPAWRHGVFVAINGAVAAGMFRRPRIFAWLFSLLTVQQLFSHGTYGWQIWTCEGRVDWQSALVLVVLPPLAALMWWDVRRRVREPRRET